MSVRSVTFPRLVDLRRKLAVAASLTLIVGLTGCGNIGPSGGRRAPEDAYSRGLTTQGFADPQSYGATACQDRPYNVKPRSSSSYNGSGNYTACAIDGQSASVELHGETTSSDTICVFPGQYYAPDQYNDYPRVVWKVDQNGFPMYKCQSISNAGGSLFTFNLTNYDFVYVVELPWKDQMRTCLLQGNEYLCPNYASGRFR